MRKITLLLTIVVSIAVAGIAAAAPVQKMDSMKKAAPMQKGSMSSKMVYVCEKCDMAHMKPGTCEMCKKKLMPMKAKMMYACMHCKTTSAKMGKCSKCKMDMQKVAAAYACDHCHTTSDKAGKCAKCKMEMKKKMIPMAKK